MKISTPKSAFSLLFQSSIASLQDRQLNGLTFDVASVRDRIDIARVKLTSHGRSFQIIFCFHSLSIVLQFVPYFHIDFCSSSNEIMRRLMAFYNR